MTTLTTIKSKKTAASILSTTQKTFNRLKKKIETLQKKLQQLTHTLGECAEFQTQLIEPLEKAFAQTCEEQTKILYRHYTKKTPWSEKEKKELKELIQQRLKIVYNAYHHFSEVNPEVAAIFKELEGQAFEDRFSEEFTDWKETLKAMGAERGLDLDLDDLHIHDQEDDLFRKFFESFQTATDAQIDREEEPPVRPKTKKQLAREEKERALEELKKKDLGRIYKQLAKVFHPDLEQDPVQKESKATLMKRLTTAYEENDLHTLLSLEMAWLNQNEQQKQSSDAQLKLYNQILQEQVDALQEGLELIPQHPQYFKLQNYLSRYGTVDLFLLQIIFNQLQSAIRDFQDLNHKLEGRSAVRIIREILAEHF